MTKTLLVCGLLFCSPYPVYACLDDRLSDQAQFAQCLASAAEGELDSQFLLAGLYAEGRGVSRDIQSAESWYFSAADQGEPRAQYALAKLYEARASGKHDYTRALDAFRALSALDPESIQANLGITFDQCMEIAAETSPAIVWYQRAAEQGLAVAQLELGLIFEFGRGVPANDSLAYMWFDIAARRGLKDAHEYRDSIALRMSDEQTRRAGLLAQAWLLEHLAMSR